MSEAQQEQLCYVAELDGKIIGLMRGTLKSNYAYFAEKNYADLTVLYVHPNFQNMGIGTILKDVFISWAKEKGFQKFVIGVLKDNEHARKVYEIWGGKLNRHTEFFYKLGVGYKECFYTFFIK